MLRTLFLTFNEGYASQSPNAFIRKEFCLQALSLSLVLTENPSKKLSCRKCTHRSHVLSGVTF